MEPPIREESPAPPPPVLDGQLHLLDSFQGDDLTKYRRREAAWVSLAVHAVILLLLLFLPKWSRSSPVLVPLQSKEEPVFIDAPATPLEKKPLRSDVVSDQNRVAQARTPVPDKQTLRKILDTERPGPPKNVNPTPPAQSQQVAQEQAPQAPQGQPSFPAQPQQTAKLTIPQQPKQNPWAIRSAGASVDEAIRNAANNPTSHTSTTFTTSGGHYGSGLRPKVDTAGAFDILSDTMGVDFGPYLARLKHTVQDHWEPLIPVSAMPPQMKRGRVVIEFLILKDGTVAEIRMVGGSGDEALDKAAEGALTSSTPLPRLPIQFAGDSLRIRAAFFYNPEKNDFE